MIIPEHCFHCYHGRYALVVKDYAHERNDGTTVVVPRVNFFHCLDCSEEILTNESCDYILAFAAGSGPLDGTCSMSVKTTMPFKLTHIGEALLEQMAKAKPDKFWQVCGLPAPDPSWDWLVKSEVPLAPYANRRFDGAHRIDLLLRTGPAEAVAIEAKLGTTGLGKARVNKWFDTCNSSHGDKRWQGSMMAILEHKFHDGPNEDIVATVAGRQFRISRIWRLIARKSVIDSWTPPNLPNFSKHVVAVSFDALVSEFTKEEFNVIVRNLMHFDYYETWLNQPA